MNQIFANEKINTGRQSEVDFSKGFTALLMVICHVGLFLGDNSDTALYCFSDIIGSEWCAPVFMALMGIGLVYSRHQSPKLLLRRGVVIFITSYVLSFFRTILPLLIFGNIDVWTQTASFFVVDILQFAGLTFMFFALLKKIKMPSLFILFLSLVMVGIGQVMMTYVCPNISGEVSYFVNLFFPANTWSCFPFFTWFFFPAFGLCFGELLIRCSNKNKLYAILLPISFCGVLVVYIQFYFLYPNYAYYYFGGNFYYMGIENVLLTTCFICFSLASWHFLGKILPQFTKRYLSFLGKNLNLFYIVSWLVISLIMHIKAYCNLTFNAHVVIVLMVLLNAFCSFMAFVVLSVKKRVFAHCTKAKI